VERLALGLHPETRVLKSEVKDPDGARRDIFAGCSTATSWEGINDTISLKKTIATTVTASFSQEQKKDETRRRVSSLNQAVFALS